MDMDGWMVRVGSCLLCIPMYVFVCICGVCGTG